MAQTLVRGCFGVLVWGVLAAGVSGLPSFLCRNRLTLCMVVMLSSLGYSSTPVCTSRPHIQTDVSITSSDRPAVAMTGDMSACRADALGTQGLNALHHGRPGGRHDAVQRHPICVACMLAAVPRLRGVTGIH